MLGVTDLVARETLCRRNAAVSTLFWGSRLAVDLWWVMGLGDYVLCRLNSFDILYNYFVVYFLKSFTGQKF